MAAFYHIYITPQTGVTRAKVEEQLNLAKDWFRYHERCYVVETTSDELKWQARLLPLVQPTGHLFICKLDFTHYEGFMNQAFWDWIRPKLT